VTAGPAPLALTCGDLAGIGPEISAKAWSRRRRDGPCFFWLGDPAALKGLGVPMAPISAPHEAPALFTEALPVLPVTGQSPAAVTIGAIAAGTRLVLDGQASALVTNPISKKSLADAGFAYPGHTEFLGALTGSPVPPVMMLAIPGLRVVPATVHVPLAKVPDLLSEKLLVETARTLHAALKRDFGCAVPRIAVAGLNPHAGEQGLLGTEEQTIIAPAIAAMTAEGMNVWGPVPPDALFTPRARETYDAALCLYHDQALIPLKALDVDHGVNVTLGLPIIRTSPDHGIAADIAGKGIADPASLLAALDLAARMAAGRGPV